MRKSLLAVVFIGFCTSSVQAENIGLGSYLTGNASIGLTRDQQTHYVAGMMHAWLLDAFVSNGK